MANWPQILLSLGGIFAVVAGVGSYMQQKNDKAKMDELTQENLTLSTDIQKRTIEFAKLQEEYTHFATGDMSFPTLVLTEDSTKQYFQATLRNMNEYPIYTCSVQFTDFPDKNGIDRRLKFDTLGPFTEMRSSLKIIPITDKNTKKYIIDMFTPSAKYVQCYMLKYINEQWASAWCIVKKNGKRVQKPIEGEPNAFTNEIEYENEFKSKHYDNGAFSRADIREFEEFYTSVHQSSNGRDGDRP